MFNALLYKKHPTLYRQRIQAAPPWRYYVATLSLILAFAALIAGSKAGALLGVALWLGHTLWFSSQRLQRTRRCPRHVTEMLLTSAVIPMLSVYWRLRGAWHFRVMFL
jgi:hypothetical protein